MHLVIGIYRTTLMQDFTFFKLPGSCFFLPLSFLSSFMAFLQLPCLDLLGQWKGNWPDAIVQRYLPASTHRSNYSSATPLNSTCENLWRQLTVSTIFPLYVEGLGDRRRLAHLISLSKSNPTSALSSKGSATCYLPSHFSSSPLLS